GANELRQFASVRRFLLQHSIASHDRIGGREVGFFLIFPRITSIGARQRLEIAQNFLTPTCARCWLAEKVQGKSGCSARRRHCFQHGTEVHWFSSLAAFAPR